MPDVVPFLDLPGRVPTEGGRFSGAAPAGPVCRLCPQVLLGLQGQLAPWAGLPGKQPAHYLLPTRRKQVPPFCAFIPFTIESYGKFQMFVLSISLSSYVIYQITCSDSYMSDPWKVQYVRLFLKNRYYLNVKNWYLMLWCGYIVLQRYRF